MSPFIGHPEGFSADSLELLDQGLRQIWHQMQIEAEAKSKKPEPTAAGRPSSIDGVFRGSRLRHGHAQAIVK